ncbi:MAG: glycosyltransferase [Candidatus Zixiibacteriota bacterium]
MKSNTGFSKMPIVCLSTQDYGDLWTRKQRFMNMFADEGHRVLYVESQWHWLTYFKRFSGQVMRPTRFLNKPRRLKGNLFVATPPILLPFHQMVRPIAVVNNLILGLWLRWTTRRIGISDSLVYSYVPYSHLAIRVLGSKKVLYEKVDDLAAAKGLVRRATVEALEKKLLKMSQLVIVTATKLKSLMGGKHDSVHVIPNACEIEHFNGSNTTATEPQRLRAITHPRIGFVGMLAYWIDLDIIEKIATERPEWQFVFIGPVSVDVSRFDRLNNIHFVGRVPYDYLPSYMDAMDVFINPYRRDDIAESCSPLKVFEYLAAGKPVVSVAMPEVMRFAPLVKIADSPESFIARITELLKMTHMERRKLSTQLRALVRNDNWEDRFARTRKLLQETYGI